MSEPFVFISTSAVKEGRLDEFKKRFQEVSDLVEEKEPRMRHFTLYVAEDGTEETTVQFHDDAENMAYHMSLVGDHIRESQEYLDFSKMRIQIYGTPTEPILEQMRQLAGSGVEVTIMNPALGFNRLATT